MIEARILMVLITMSFSLGLYNIAVVVFKIPTYNSNFIKNIFKKKNKNNQDKYSNTTHEIAKKLKLPNFLEESLKEKLRMADINTTPELYVANIINNSLTYMICAIIFIPIQRIVSFVFIFLSINNMFKGYKNIDDKIKIKTEKIEKEIPKFLDFMTNSFKFNKNVKQALESYEKIAGESFRSNIQITIADMTTGNYETALKRLDARVNSYSFSKVIRAIIQVVKGDENTQYLVNLYRESASTEYERLKLESNKKIDKVGKYSKVLLMCIAVIVFTVIGLMIYKNFVKVGGLY